MRTDAGRSGPDRSVRGWGGRRLLLAASLLWAAVLLPGGAWAADEAGGKPGADWQSWHADTDVADLASVQRGARNFVAYCLGCHSLKYERWSRLGKDLGDPRGAAAEGAAAAGRQRARLHSHRHAGQGCADLVRQDSARPVADGARARARLHLPVPEDLLRRSRAPDRREQPAPAGHRHAGRALGPRRAQARRVARRPGRRGRGRHRADARPFRADRPGRA